MSKERVGIATTSEWDTSNVGRLRHFLSRRELAKADNVPANYLALQQTFETIASGSTERETVVKFLTNGKDLIVPVFAATGVARAVYGGGDWNRELIDRIIQNPELSILVDFHNHPNFRKPDFSEHDKKFFVGISDIAHFTSGPQGQYLSWPNENASIYTVVGNLNSEYRWWKLEERLSQLMLDSDMYHREERAYAKEEISKENVA